MDNNSNKIIYIFLAIAVTMFLIVGGTLAYWSWQSAAAQNTAISFTVTSDLACSADGGGSITSNDVKLAPAKCTDTEHAIQRTITTNTTTPLSDEIINMDLWLDINNIDTNLRNSDNFKYAVTTSPDSCTSGVVTAGDAFKNKISSNKAYLFNNKEYIGSQNKTYYLWIWLDEAETNNNTQNKSFNLSLNGECRDTGEQVVKVYIKSDVALSLGDYKTQVTKVEFVDNKNISTGAITFNLGDTTVSGTQATDVQGWLVDNGLGDDTYTLKIGANGRIYAKSLQNAFINMTNVTEFDFSNLDTSETTIMANMFEGCLNLITLDVSSFDTSNVTTMNSMFRGRSNSAALMMKLENIIGLENFNTSKVRSMSYMFQYCPKLTTINLSSFDTSNVTTMDSMFDYCKGLTTFDLSNFNTSKVTNMQSMFSYCTSLTELNLSSFDTSNVTNMSYMFFLDSKLRTIYVSNLWSTSAVTSSTGMFNYTTSLVGGNGTTYNSSNIDATYARIDTASTPGYFTYKAHS